MVRTDRFRCNRCTRKFLTEDSLRRHYDRQPKHSEPVTLDVRSLKTEGTALKDAEWVEFDDRVETFLTVADAVDEEGLEMTYRPDEGTVVIGGVIDQTIDVDRMQKLASNRMRWSYDGTNHRLAFLK